MSVCINVFHLQAKSPGIIHEVLKIALVRYAVQILPVFLDCGFRGSSVRPSVSESTPQGCSDDSHAGWFTHDPRALLHATLCPVTCQRQPRL